MTTVLDHAPIARDGFKRLEPDITTSTDQTGHTAIDGIYHKDTPNGPQHQIVNQKHATNGNWHLGHVVSGDTQLSPIRTSQRLEDYFRDPSGAINPTSQAHLDTLQDYFNQVTKNPTAQPARIDVFVHVQAMDGGFRVTDTTTRNTFAPKAVTPGSTPETRIENDTTPKDEP